MKNFIGGLVLVSAVFAGDLFMDWPRWFFFGPEIWECVSAEEITTQIEDDGFEFCAP